MDPVFGDFIDRDEELAELSALHKRPEGALVVLVGRRRVGKTALLREFMKGRSSIYFMATEERDAENRSYFRNLVADFTGNALVRAASALSWEDLFRLAVDAAEAKRDEGKLVLVIDEYQYLTVGNPAFSSLLQRVWDTLLKPAGCMLVLCGSYIGMMERETLSYSSPLYGRRDALIRLQPIPFRLYPLFFPGREPTGLVPFYAVTGGVPRYIEAFRKETDIRRGISRVVLNRRGILYEEPYLLLEREVSEIGSYFSLLKTVAAGNHRLFAIAGRLEVPQTSLSRPVSTLLSLDILERVVPITEEHPEHSKRSLYRIRDPFLRFWFRFVYPHRSALESGKTEEVEGHLDREFISRHMAQLYEDICRQRLWDLSGEGGLGFPLTRVGSYWESDREIDVVGWSAERRILVACECKYQSHPVGLRVLEDLITKVNAIQWRIPVESRRYVLFSRSGFEASLLHKAESDSSLLLEQL